MEVERKVEYKDDGLQLQPAVDVAEYSIISPNKSALFSLRAERSDEQEYNLLF